MESSLDYFIQLANDVVLKQKIILILILMYISTHNLIIFQLSKPNISTHFFPNSSFFAPNGYTDLNPKLQEELIFLP